MMTSHRAGDDVTITVFRGRRKMDVRVKLGDAKNQTQAGQRDLRGRTTSPGYQGTSHMKSNGLGVRVGCKNVILNGLPVNSSF